MRVKCVTDIRSDLGTNIVDPFIRKGAFYEVLTPEIPAPCGSGPEWIEIQCSASRQSFTRPRYMFGPLLSPNTTYRPS